MQQAKGAPGGDASTDESSADSGAYNKDMDNMRCILYAHGGTLRWCFLIHNTHANTSKAVITSGASIKSGKHLRFFGDVARPDPRPSYSYSIQRHARKINGRVFGAWKVHQYAAGLFIS